MEKTKVGFSKILVYILLIIMIAIILLVAKRDIKQNVTSINGDKMSFSLSGVANNETDVEKIEGQKIIAPGTRGKFCATVKNDSEVTAKYNMSYNIENAQNIPIEYSIDEKTWTKDIAEINAQTEQYIILPIGAEENSQTIYWRWKYDGTDSQDTTLGINGTASIKVTLTMTAEQVDKTVTKDEGDTSTPYIPTGFRAVEGTSLASGYTIQDSTGNQYVWVEVPKTEEVYQTAGIDLDLDNVSQVSVFTLRATPTEDDYYTAIENDLKDYTSTYRNGTSYVDEFYTNQTSSGPSNYEIDSGETDSEDPVGSTGLTRKQYYTLKKKMLKSIYQNGGFYIGKYEVGIESGPKTSGSSSTEPIEKPVIKQNAYPYNNVTCSQAQTLASSMESGGYTSSLMFGLQWDLMLKYFETKGITQFELNTISTKLGNYTGSLWNITNINSKYSIDYGESWTSGPYGDKISTVSKILLSTGADEAFSKQGIYDFAGNVRELTLEYTSDKNNPCASRGGDYVSTKKNSSGSYYPASSRISESATFYYYRIGFRVSLY